MRLKIFLLITLLAIMIAVSSFSEDENNSSDRSESMSLNDCIEYILQTDPVIKEAELSIEGARYLKKQAKGAGAPKLNIFMYGGPTPKVTGNALSSDIDWSKWGIFGRIEAELQVPLFTFGRIGNGKKAAESNILLTQAQYKETKFKEVNQFKYLYYGRLYAKTMLTKVLVETEKNLKQALAEAEQQYADMTGDVTKADIGRLKMGLAEIRKYVVDAKKYLELTEAGLVEYLGVDSPEELNFKDDFLYKEKAEIKDMKHYLDLAFQTSPLWQQVNAGVDAMYALWKMEKSNFAPILFIGAQFNISGATAIDDQKSFFASDMYNEIGGGLALGIMWNFDPWFTSAKAGSAEVEYKKILQTKKFAESGLKILIKNALLTIKEKEEKIKIARDAVKAGKKWMSFSFMGYMIGTQEAQEALEGLAAYALAQNDYYQAIFDYNMALSDLSGIIGQDIATELVWDK